MSTALLVVILTLFGLTLTACAKIPTNPNLIEARERFDALQRKPESYWLAADEVREAFKVLAQADLLSNEDAGSPGIDQLSQVAKHKIALAEQAITDRRAGQQAW